MNPNFRNFALWAIIALLLVALFSMFQTTPSQTSSREIPYSQFIREVDAGRVRDVTVTGNRVLGTYVENGTAFQTYAPVIDETLLERLQSKNVMIVGRPETDGSSGFLSYLGTLLPMLLILGVWLFFMRQMQGGSRGAMGFGKSKAKLLTEAHGRVTFEDVAGVDEAKQDLEEIVEFLRDPQKFQRLGARFHAAFCSSALRAPARPCSPAPLPAKPTFRSSPSRAPTSLKCSSVSVRRAFVTCSSRPRRMHLASSSSTKSTPWVAIVALASAAATTNVNRP